MELPHIRPLSLLVAVLALTACISCSKGEGKPRALRTLGATDLANDPSAKLSEPAGTASQGAMSDKPRLPRAFSAARRRVLRDVEEASIPTGRLLRDPPPSPYVERDEACVSRNGMIAEIRGYPSTPFPVVPFQVPYKEPEEAKKLSLVCNQTAGGCLASYYVEIKESTKSYKGAVPACVNKPAKILGYNGSSPGPTFRTPVGQQNLVRFVNKLVPGAISLPEVEPCKSDPNRVGRPTTVHWHGSASLAPYDGWAEDVSCGNEAKDYILPARRAATLWYHDHALDRSTEHDYLGLSGFHFVSEKLKDGGRGERWGLENMGEVLLKLADKVLDGNCQHFYDLNGVHEDDLYGDINTVNGDAWPVLQQDPKWARFRALNSAVSRPWLLKIVDNKGYDVSSKICQVIASDGGFRRAPVQFPSKGLFIGVAERYEWVCDFRSQAGKTLYIWNVYDEDRMKDVPFWCYSHLVMKIVVGTTCKATDGSCQATFQPVTRPTYLDQVLSNAEVEEARQKARNGYCDREFDFGRSNGKWVINNEDWFSARVAAVEPANAAEIWCFKTGGGWFHPIHVHLVDFYVLYRDEYFEPYEQEVPKDVVNLHPGTEVAILARWGPHRGEYMFHCHNLRHQDNDMLRSFISGTGLNTSKPFIVPEVNANTQPALKNFVFLGPTGILYDNYDSPRYPPAAPKPVAAAPPLNTNYSQQVLSRELYRVFHPGTEDRQLLCNRNINPWLIRDCA